MKRATRALGLAAAVACLCSAYAAAQASATEFYMYVPTTITETEPLEGSLETGTEAVLKSKAFGATVEIKSNAAVVTGSIDNNAAGGTQGHGTNIQLHFTNAVVLKPANCTVHDPISLNPGAVNGTLTTTPAEALAEAGKISFKPEGAVFAHLEFTGASCSLNKLNLTVEGTAVANVNVSAKKLEFTETSGSSLTFGGQPATMTATFQAKSTGTYVEPK